MAGPLSHIRVLDLSRILAGPWATQTLADLGAEVIKVERPGAGDDTRSWGPPFVQGEEPASRTAAYFLAANRGKRSVTIDFTRAEGQALVRELARQCDVFVENFKVGGLEKYGLDWPSLRNVNPRLVYCSITGFGQQGPRAARAGYDFMIQGMGGLMSITGKADGEPGGEPVKVGVAVADLFTGLYSTVGILAALASRERTGKGQQVDMALLDCQVAMLANQASNFLVSGKAPERLGNAHPNIVPYQAFEAEDGHLILAIGNDSQYRRFCDVAERPELGNDPRFATNPTRVEHRELLVPIMADIIRSRRRDDWLTALEAVGVPCGPVNTIDQVFSDPQVKTRSMAIALEHPVLGSVPMVANPVHLSETPVAYDRPPPLLGEHTDEVLQGLLGMSGDDIAQLRRKEIV